MRPRTTIAGLLAAALMGGAAALVAVPAAAFQVKDDPFATLVGKRRESVDPHADGADVERFVTASGEQSFLLESHGDEARIKFLCGAEDPRLDCLIDPEGPVEEIFLLTMSRGSRGDRLYRDASGETVLKIAAHGGATVRWPGERQSKGAYKGYVESVGPLELTPEGRGTAHRRAQIAAAHLSALSGSAILFDIPERERRGDREARSDARLAAAPMSYAPAAAPEAVTVTGARVADAADDQAEESDRAPGSRRGRSTVLADAVARVAGGMHQVASDATGARILAARISMVRFVESSAAGLTLNNGVLTVQYDPQGGLAGRPSSTAVAKFLEESL